MNCLLSKTSLERCYSTFIYFPITNPSSRSIKTFPKKERKIKKNLNQFLEKHINTTTLIHFGSMFHFYNPLKTSEINWFSDVFWGYRNRTLGQMA